MKQIIDIENWERKENFNFFRHFQNPQLSITSEVECGGARQRAKAAGQSFFLHYLYAVLRAANEIPEFIRFARRMKQAVIGVATAIMSTTSI